MTEPQQYVALRAPSALAQVARLFAHKACLPAQTKFLFTAPTCDGDTP